MEPHMFVEMVNDIKNKGIPIAKVAGDDDHTGINQVHKQGNLDIIKESDKNHVRKNVAKKLYALQKEHKSLTQKVISAVTKNFNYMLQQNHGKPDAVKDGIKAVVEHMFGNHSYCQEWCGYLKDPKKYKHHNLSYGKDLCDESLHKSLSDIFNTLDIYKLAFLASTQVNESFNNTLISKAPKARHYSDSSSLEYRLCASVSQKNEGYTYIMKVHEVAGLSPSLCAKKRAVQIERQMKCKKERQSSIEFKQRRLQLKGERKVNDTAYEVREGDTYVSNIGQEKNVPDTVEIPRGDDTAPTVVDGVTYVMFDLETGGLARTSDILQISAVCGDTEFNSYVTPTQPISKASSKVTKLTEINHQLYFNGKVVDAIGISDALSTFLDFLAKTEKPVLVGHNIKTFDLMFLHKYLSQYGQWKHFTSLVVGFVDTYQVFKEFPKQGSYKQDALVNDLLHESYSAHNSLDDVKALQKLSQVVMSAFPRYIFGATAIVNTANSAIFKATLRPLEESKAVSKTMSSKIAKSGLNYSHLKSAIVRNGLDGLQALLSEDVNGKVRVTKDGRIIKRIFDYFTNE